MPTLIISKIEVQNSRGQSISYKLDGNTINYNFNDRLLNIDVQIQTSEMNFQLKQNDSARKALIKQIIEKENKIGEFDVEFKTTLVPNVGSEHENFSYKIKCLEKGFFEKVLTVEFQ